MKMWVGVVFMVLVSCNQKNQSLKIKGSDTEVNLTVQLAEEIKNESIPLIISVSGGGSGLGITSLLNGNAEIANSSRTLNYKEHELFKQKSIQIDSFNFAQDALAIIVSDKNPMDSVSVNELKTIFDGKRRFWNIHNFEKKPITIYGRQSNSGTFEYLKNKLNIKFSEKANQLNGNAQIIEAVKTNPYSIGYVGAGYVKYSKVGYKILKIYNEHQKAVSPLQIKEVENGNYYFKRPLFQYYKAKDYSILKRFFEFEMSNSGKRIITEAGYFNVNRDEKTQR